MPSTNPSYGRVPSSENGEEWSPNDEVVVENGSSIEPFEVEDSTTALEDESSRQQDQVSLFNLKETWLVSISITLLIVIPTLILAMTVAFQITGRMWAATLFSIHMVLATLTCHCLLKRQKRAYYCDQCIAFSSFLLDCILFGFFYPNIASVLTQYYLTEPDGTTVIEWTWLKRRIDAICFLGNVVVMFRVITVVALLLVIIYQRGASSLQMPTARLPRIVVTAWDRVVQWEASVSLEAKHRFIQLLKVSVAGMLVASILLAGWSIASFTIHWGQWEAPRNHDGCDYLDTTDCALPFPSMNHMVRDDSTETGWRVNLRGNVLPPLKGRVEIDPSFLNELDGFSTMAPMLFYMDKLKEADETYHQEPRLQGPSNIANSVTNRSITLLLNVDSQQLVPHSAEIDYLDPDRPLVLMFPAQPLQHATHYAVAVVNAVDEFGVRLQPTAGMLDLLSTKYMNHQQSIHRSRYQGILIPSLTEAARWVRYGEDPSSLQLLFDFWTVSEGSQLGPVRTVRDATLNHVSSPNWGSWDDHVEIVKQVDGTCKQPGQLLARTIHVIMDVPWFLTNQVQRDTTLDQNAVKTLQPNMVGKAKFVLHIPCSVREASLNGSNATVNAILEFGHGLFYHRHEASDEFLLRMANDNRYVIMAMDWRGMSAFDLLIVVKTLMAKPRLFECVRDNLIQGYANKFAMQHFSQNGMLDMDWFNFGTTDKSRARTRQTPRPVSAFYGISQGGILGAGYSALSGPTKLLDRSILGVPGTPFAFILTRSTEFVGYDAILLLNFYNNRHVRILLSLVQMAWDSVEASGTLAPPVTEPYPQILLQAGLGDATVPTQAAEALGRAFQAQILPGNPRQDIFRIPVAKKSFKYHPPHVTLSEMYYETEYKSLPLHDIRKKRNGVHGCVRHEPVMMRQLTEFVNSGSVLDVCASDNATCVRHKAC